MKAYNVYLDGKGIDKVFWVGNSDAEEVKRSLIEHDGYDPGINVRQERKRPTDRPTVKAIFILQELRYQIETDQLAKITFRADGLRHVKSAIRFLRGEDK